MGSFRSKQKGVVSLFVVIFATLLITVVTVGFARIMMQGQMQASVNDLSQSAYDSAQAGVEDAKRAILRYQAICDSDPANCSSTEAQVVSPICNQAVGELLDVASAKTSEEVKVQNGSDPNELDQAYTCVKIQLDTDDYEGFLSQDESKIIPLKGISAFNAVQIDWFVRSDAGSTSIALQPGSSTSWRLFATNPVNAWAPNRPPIMRAQLIQFSDNGFTLSNFDNSSIPGQSNAHTLFLYPSDSATNTAEFQTRDIRRQSANPAVKPFPASCKTDISTVIYACSMRLSLPAAIGGSGDNRIAYLNLRTIYNKANYRVILRNASGNIVKFDNVQPLVDSTGRANDLFRRIEARIEPGSDFSYPYAAIHTDTNLCKEFLVTDLTDHYQPGSCTP